MFTSSQSSTLDSTAELPTEMDRSQSPRATDVPSKSRRILIGLYQLKQTQSKFDSVFSVLCVFCSPHPATDTVLLSYRGEHYKCEWTHMSVVL